MADVETVDLHTWVSECKSYARCVDRLAVYGKPAVPAREAAPHPFMAVALRALPRRNVDVRPEAG